MNALTTSAASEEIALGRLRGDWDADGTISVHLPVDVAERLLAERGWQVRPGGAAWLSPSGQRYWHTSEALAIALIAENS